MKKKIMKKIQKVLLILFSAVALIIFFDTKTKAQIALHSNMSYSKIRNDVSIENKKALLGYNYGIAVQYYPFRNAQKLSVINEFNFSRKGYRQNFEEEYEFKFDYLSFPILVDYSLFHNISLQTGVELSQMIDANIEGWKDTYNKFDLGLVLGTSYYYKKKWSLYIRFTYGVLPILDYYNIDDLGNFNGKIHDLKNISVALGIKFNITNEKITCK